MSGEEVHANHTQQQRLEEGKSLLDEEQGPAEKDAKSPSSVFQELSNPTLRSWPALAVYFSHIGQASSSPGGHNSFRGRLSCVPCRHFLIIH